ncbi:MAG: YihY/virulence factor BrkB family protein [Chthoniobacterales bacterium]|jgi:membrane protein|nr:YihY/virulence factor BrkB family protein [Chthoniobacterales bacterium]
MKRFFQISKEAVSEFLADDAMSLAAALALYTVIALAPLVTVMLTIAGMALGDQAAQMFVQQAEGLLGKSGAEAIKGIVDNASKPSSGIIQGIIGFIILLTSASAVFAQLQASLNRIWNVVTKPGLGIMHVIKTRLFSMSVVAVLGFLLLVSLVVSTGLAALGSYFKTLASSMEVLLHVVNFLVAVGVTTVLFACIFKYIPDVIIRWRDVWIGALVTAILFNVGQIGLGVYLGHSATATSYGAAGSFMVLILWLYYSTLILFYGAEWAQVRARVLGNRFEPAAYANRLVVEARDANDPKAESKVADKSAKERMAGKS